MKPHAINRMDRSIASVERQSLRIMLVAGEAAGMRCLRALSATDHQIVGVITSSDRTAATGASVAVLARQLGLPLWPAEKVKDATFAQTVAALEVDVLLNIHSLYIVLPEILCATRLGAYNLHPGPLPGMAGLNSPSWAIYRGHKVHSVTLHKMERTIDTGPIVYRSDFDITNTDTALSIMSKCVSRGLPLVLRLIEELSHDPDGIPQLEHEDGERNYFGREVPNRGRLSWSVRADDVTRFVRACDYYPFESPWGYPKTWLDQIEIGIVRTAATGEKTSASPGSVLSASQGGVCVACADETVKISHVILQDRFRLASEVLSPGQRLSDEAS